MRSLIIAMPAPKSTEKMEMNLVSAKRKIAAQLHMSAPSRTRPEVGFT